MAALVKYLLIALLAIVGLKGTKAQNCGLPSCGDNEHIDCYMQEGAWGEKCPEDKNMLNLATVNSQLVNRHNEHRNRIAGGTVTGFKAAKRMGTLSWNITLGNLCRKNVRQCDTVVDGCRNTPEYNFVGQNVAYKKYPVSDTTSNINIMLELIDLWYNEISNATMTDMLKFSGETTKGEVSHATQLLKAYATRVGCAASATVEGNWRTLFFCCNYDIGNIRGYPTYDEGTTAGSGCKTGKHTTYKNLCSINEIFNINNFWEDYQ